MTERGHGWRFLTFFQETWRTGSLCCPPHHHQGGRWQEAPPGPLPPHRAPRSLGKHPLPSSQAGLLPRISSSHACEAPKCSVNQESVLLRRGSAAGSRSTSQVGGEGSCPLLPGVLSSVHSFIYLFSHSSSLHPSICPSILRCSDGLSPPLPSSDLVLWALFQLAVSFLMSTFRVTVDEDGSSGTSQQAAALSPRVLPRDVREQVTCHPHRCPCPVGTCQDTGFP